MVAKGVVPTYGIQTWEVLDWNGMSYSSLKMFKRLGDARASHVGEIVPSALSPSLPPPRTNLSLSLIKQEKKKWTNLFTQKASVYHRFSL
jgi:hypothetical protein